MRSPHQLHGVFDVAPLFGFFGVALVLASLGILGRLDDSLEAVLLEHLTRDHVNLYLGYHVALLMFHHAPGTAEADAFLWPTPRAVEPEVSVLLVAHVILRLSIKKEEGDLREFSSVSGEQRLCCERAPLRRPVEPANAFRTQVGHRGRSEKCQKATSGRSSRVGVSQISWSPN